MCLLLRQVVYAHRPKLYSLLPRCEGDYLVTTLGSITIDATKGNRKVPFSLSTNNL